MRNNMMKKLFPLFLLLECIITANAQTDSPTLSADRPGISTNSAWRG